MASIKERTGGISDKANARETRKLLEAVLADNTALRASILAITAKLDVLTAKLNADGGVTDTNYATDFASATNPAALTLTA
jgi:hypothetical protein